MLSCSSGVMLRGVFLCWLNSWKIMGCVLMLF